MLLLEHGLLVVPVVRIPFENQHAALVVFLDLEWLRAGLQRVCPDVSGLFGLLAAET